MNHLRSNDLTFHSIGQLDNPTFLETHPNHLSFERCLYCEYLQWGVLFSHFDCIGTNQYLHVETLHSAHHLEKKRIFLSLLVIYFLRLHHPMSSHSDGIAIATIVTNNQSNQRSHKDTSCITHYLLCPIHPSRLFLAARDANSPVMFPQRNLENSGEKKTHHNHCVTCCDRHGVTFPRYCGFTWIWYPAL